MNRSQVLSLRKIQPGSAKFGLPTHEKFEKAMESFPGEVLVLPEPKYFKNHGYRAMVPDYCVVQDDKAVFFELKRQNGGGNAQERVYKNFSAKKVKDIETRFDCKYPLYAIFADALSYMPRYTEHFAQNLEEYDYLLWVDYDNSLLHDFVSDCIARGGIDLTKTY